MKKFKFRLQKVLDYRQTILDEKKRVLMQKNADLYETEGRLENTINSWNLSMVESGSVLAAEDLHNRSIFLSKVQDDIEILKQRIESIKVEIAEAMQEYLQANQDVKALELLKDKKHKAYKKALDMEESKTLDELVIQRHGRKTGL